MKKLLIQPESKETLDRLEPGTLAAVLDFSRSDRPSMRLQEMGVIPGADIEVLCSGETMLVRVGEHRMSLRRQAAQAIVVKPIL